MRWGDPPLGLYSLPLLLADRAGAFTAGGERLRLESNQTGNDYTQGLLEERFDVGHIGTPPYINAVLRGAPYAIVAQGAYVVAPFYLVTAPGLEGGSLEGKRVAVNKLETCPHSVLATTLRTRESSLSSVEIVTLGSAERMVCAAEAGAADAAVLWEPYVSYLERALGWRVAADAAATIPSSYGMVLYAHRELINDAPGLVSEAIAAATRAFLPMSTESLASYSWAGVFPRAASEDIHRGLARERLRWTMGERVHIAVLDRALVEASLQAGRDLGLSVRDLVPSADDRRFHDRREERQVRAP